jgi:hypothetical protein
VTPGIERVSFEGRDCVRLVGDGTGVFVTTSVGPRILGLVGSEGNVLAVLPQEAGLEHPSGRRFRFVGGHRLWAAPEVPATTYEPDDRPCTVTEAEDGIRVEAPADGAGLARAIEVRRSLDGWVVDHAIRNLSPATVTMAPWAITQLRPGGEAILPLGPMGDGPQADRSLVLWPYTDPGDPRIAFRRNEVRIRAVPGPAPIKVGAAPSEGRVAYRLGGEVFEKRVAVDPRAPYPDRGAAVQVYLGDDFCELETVGPLRAVDPGDEATHRERWALRREGAHPARPDEPRDGR